MQGAPRATPVAMIADRDLAIRGNPSTDQTNYTGLFGVAEQLKMNRR